jgi:hypothetical protein
MIYIQVDSIHYLSRLILKQSIHETLVQLDSKQVSERIETYTSTINEIINLRKMNDFDYSVNVIGFHPDPLAMRVKLMINHKGENKKVWEFDETMIEVES